MVRVRAGDALLRIFAEGWRRKLDDAAEKLLVLRTLLGTEQGVGMSEERGIDGVPVRANQMQPRERNKFVFLETHVVPMKCRKVGGPR